MILRLAAALTLAASMFFLHRAATPIFEQNAKVRRWPATDVTVTIRFIETPVRRRPGSSPGGGESKLGALPAVNTVIELRHQVGGHIFTTTRFNPRTEEIAPVAGPDLFTMRQASYVRPGHYHPERPGELFMPKAFGFGDYAPLFLWAPAFALGFGGLFLRRPGRAATALMDRATKGWYRVPPKYSIRYRARGAWGVAVVCNALLGLAVFDYFTGEPRARTTSSDVLVCLATLPGVITIGLAVYYAWMARRVGEPRVSVDAVRVRPGERLAVRVELPLKRELDLEHITVGLTCVRGAFENTGHGPGWRERELYAERVERDVGRRAGAGTRVWCEQRFQVPPDAAPSSLSHAGFAGPWIDWYVEVRCHLDNGPDYRGRFPVTVEAA